MWVMKLLRRASATEKSTASLCDPAEIQLSIQRSWSTTTPKETTPVVLGPISAARGKPSRLFMHLLHLEEDHTSSLSLHCCLLQKSFWCVQFLHNILFIYIWMGSLDSVFFCRLFFRSEFFNHDAVKSDVSTKSMVIPSLPKNNQLHIM